MPVNYFCISSTLLNKIKFTVEFWQEDDLNTTGITVIFEPTLNPNKIRLVEQCPVATAVCSPLVGALEIQTLG